MKDYSSFGMIRRGVRVLKKLKVELPYNLGINICLMSGYLSKENKNTNLKRYMHSYDNCSISNSSQDMEATYVFTDKQMD